MERATALVIWEAIDRERMGGRESGGPRFGATLTASVNRRGERTYSVAVQALVDRDTLAGLLAPHGVTLADLSAEPHARGWMLR